MKPVANSANPGPHDIRIAEYVCGLLRPEEHAQIHLLLSRDDQALTLALAWEQDLLALVDALPPVQPPAALRDRLQRTLGIGPPPPPAQLLRQPSREPEAVAASPYASWNHQAAGLLSPVDGADDEAAPDSGAPNPQTPSVAPAEAVETVESFDPAGQAARLPETRTAFADPPPQATTPEPARAAPLPAEAPLRALPPEAETDPSPIPPTPSATAGRTADKGDQRRLQRKLWLWRLIALCAAGAAIVGFMMPGEPPPPPVQIVKVAPTRAAILQAPGTTSTPGWTATLGPEGNLMMQPLVHTEIPAGSQALLWTRSKNVPEPRLLGRIDPNQPVQVPAAQLGALAQDQLLEITLETDDDAARGLPNGPILFIGQIAVFGAEGASSAPADAQAAH